MDKYDPPKNQEMFVGYFYLTKNIKQKKSHREFVYFENPKRLFINIELLGTNGILCSMCDGISMFRYDNKKSPYFIDSQWVIDENIGGEIANEIKRLQNEIFSKKIAGNKLITPE